MSSLTTLLPLVVIPLILISIAALFIKKTGFSYKSKPFLTQNELEFLGRLEKALPGMRIHCQVAMSALIMPTTQKRDRRYWQARGKFAQKFVDYVVQRKDTGEVIAIIELDDRTHNAKKDSERDAMLHSANYRVIRFQSKKKPTTDEIASTVYTKNINRI